MAPAAAIAFLAWQSPVSAFQGPATFGLSKVAGSSSVLPTRLVQHVSATTDNNEAAFAAFAESLEEDDIIASTDEPEEAASSWQASLEMLLDPSTSQAKRQILFSDLLSSNEEIRESVFLALRERKIDPILTPTGKKLQDGTRAVARQITMDLLPALAESLRKSPDMQQRKMADELPTIVPKIGGRIFDALSSQAMKQLELLQGDLQDPSRIPERITKQTTDVLMEARNVFLETPEGLAEPYYKVISKGEGYEVREYEGYTAAATSMAKVGETFSNEDVASGGAAFNAIAAYLFGANSAKKSMEMTTPVATTSVGEMRFFLKKDDSMEDFPEPLAQEDSLNERGAVKLIDVPPARLAVARFSGFVTDGEVKRQKDTLLTALALDGVEIDVPHGSVVPYFVLQYNPPYTIPIVRRNEIAIPVRAPGDEAALYDDEWSSAGDYDGSDAPSDVEQ